MVEGSESIYGRTPVGGRRSFLGSNIGPLRLGHDREEIVFSVTQRCLFVCNDTTGRTLPRIGEEQAPLQAGLVEAADRQT